MKRTFFFLFIAALFVCGTEAAYTRPAFVLDQKEETFRQILLSRPVGKSTPKAYPDPVFAEHHLIRREERGWERRPVKDITGLVIHHTTRMSIEDIYRLHARSDYLARGGAPFFAYHFLILKDGQVWWLNPLTARTWHAGPANDHTVGIALHADLEKGRPTPAQAASLKDLVRTLQTDVLNRPLDIFSHQEAGSRPTQCPGRYGLQLIRDLQRENSPTL